MSDNLNTYGKEIYIIKWNQMTKTQLEHERETLIGKINRTPSTSGTVISSMKEVLVILEDFMDSVK